MDTHEIMKLAELSRLEITDAAAESYKKDFDGILGYVDSISKVDVVFDDNYQTNLTRNTIREDDEAYSAGEFTADIIAIAPDSKDNYFKVKKVL